MIGTKIYKPLNNETEQQYTTIAQWCNNNPCVIEDNGQFYEVKSENIHENEMEILRYKREEECFKVVNRGQVFYNKLSEIQKNELQSWYQAWLDVTQSKIIPVKPYWLK